MTCHEVDYHIIGHEMQVVEIELDPAETVIPEAGAHIQPGSAPPVSRKTS